MTKILPFLLFVPLTLSSADSEVAKLRAEVAALYAQVDEHQKSLTGEGNGFFTLVVARVVEAVREDELLSGTITKQASLGVAQQLRQGASFRKRVAQDSAPEIVQDENAMAGLVQSLATQIVQSGSLSDAFAKDQRLIAALIPHMEQDAFLSNLAARVAAKVTQSDVLARTIEAVERTEQAQPLSPLRRSSSSARTQGVVAERLRNDKCFLDAVCMALKGDQSFLKQVQERLQNDTLLEGVGKVLEPKVQKGIDAAILAVVATRTLVNDGRAARENRGLTIRDHFKEWKPGETRVSRYGRLLTLI